MELSRRGMGLLALGTFLLLMVLLAASTGVSYPLRHLGWQGGALLWAIVLLAGALAQGNALLRLLRLHPPEGPWYRAALAFSLGLTLLSTEVFALAASGLLGTRMLTVLLLASFALASLGLRHGWGREAPDLVREAREGLREGALPLGIASFACLMAFGLCLVPPTAFDTMVYHLEVPSRFLQAGGLVPIPENLYSNVPLLGEMLFALGLGVSGPDLAQLLSFAFFLATVVLVWGWARAAFGGAAAGWGAALLTTLPPFLVLVSFSGTDWLTSLFTLGALFLLTGRDREVGRMAVAGILAGAAAASKYPGLAFAIAIPAAAGLLFDLFRGERGRSLWAPWGVFLVAAVGFAFPWYLKNLLFTGDPFFPLLAGRLQGGASLSPLLGDAHAATLALSDLWMWSEVPFRLIFDPPAFQTGVSLGVLPLALLPLLAARDSRREPWFHLLWAVAFLAVWYASFRLGRFLLPLLALTCLWLGSGLDRVLAGAGAIPRRLLAAGVVAALLVNLGLVAGVEAEVFRSAGAATGIIGPAEYLESNDPPYSAIQYLNRIDKGVGKVLFLGETRAFYSRFPREVPSFAVPNRLLESMKGDASPTQAAEELRRAGFTHLLFNPSELARLSYPGSPWLLTPEGEERLRSFLSQRTREVFSAHGVHVLEVIGG